MGPEPEALCFRVVRPCVRVYICTYVALAHARPGEGTLRPACCRLPVHNISRGFQCASCQRSKGVNGVIGVASYGALEHVPPPSSSNNLFCSASALELYKVRRQCLMWNIFKICVLQLLKLVHFSFYWKSEKCISDISVSQCVSCV